MSSAGWHALTIRKGVAVELEGPRPSLQRRYELLYYLLPVALRPQ